MVAILLAGVKNIGHQAHLRSRLRDKVPLEDALLATYRDAAYERTGVAYGAYAASANVFAHDLELVVDPLPSASDDPPRSVVWNDTPTNKLPVLVEQVRMAEQTPSAAAFRRANGYHVPTYPNSFFKNLRNAAARSRRVRGVRARHRRTRCL